MEIEILLKESLIHAVKFLYNQNIDAKQIQIQETNKDYQGDLTVVVFPLLRISKKSPEITANELGNYLKVNIKEIKTFNVIKGFLNIIISELYWVSFFKKAYSTSNYGFTQSDTNSKTVMIEYSSPNTNKPLHLGHIRNNLLGYSISEIAKANGFRVIKTNIVNDRGIHICKSMIAWQRWGNGETPETSGKKGDHLVGEYYVLFDKEYKKQIEELKIQGLNEEIAKKNAPIIQEAQEMLRKWEANDKETRDLWKMMNDWVYKGFNETYKKLGVDFDIIYYESNTYTLGKETILKALTENILFQKSDSSIWIDLTQDGLDEKVLLRSDGTSVYMTQDIGTAQLRYDTYKFNKHIYVVGNEQDYHFMALKLVLQKMGFAWANDLFHLSYGMVELPEGKMKSREGTVVDADDLISEMIFEAGETSKELGKLDGYSDDEAIKVFETIGLGAIKYFILKVDPKKNMLFNPKESIDFNGNTGPFIQYTYARIKSVLRKAEDKGIEIKNDVKEIIQLNPKEIDLIKLIYKFPFIVREAWGELSPALIANYVFNLVKEYNQFYHDYNILREENTDIREFRLAVSSSISGIIKSSMQLLGINVPERM